MSIIPENPPDQVLPTTDASVVAYQAFAENHEPIPSFWTEREVAAFVALSARVAEDVRQTGPETWTLIDPKTREERRFSSAVAAASWLDLHPVSA